MVEIVWVSVTQSERERERAMNNIVASEQADITKDKEASQGTTHPLPHINSF